MKEDDTMTMTLTDFLNQAEKTGGQWYASGSCWCEANCPCDFSVNSTGNWNICNNWLDGTVTDAVINGKEVV